MAVGHTKAMTTQYSQLRSHRPSRLPCSCGVSRWTYYVWWENGPRATRRPEVAPATALPVLAYGEADAMRVVLREYRGEEVPPEHDVSGLENQIALRGTCKFRSRWRK